MKFVIRDDDLNYFSEPKEIVKVYKEIFSFKIPVGFSVVPFAKLTSDAWLGKINKNLPNREKEFPISQNRELVEFLKKHPLIEIMQHGCTHETKNGKFEYENKEDLLERTARGKKELERAFQRKINIFVPPHDRISNQGIRAIEALKMNIIRGVGMKNFLFRKEYIIGGIKMAFHYLKFFKKTTLPAFPFVLDFGKHKEAYSFRLNKNNLNYLISGLYFIYKKRGNFIITTHLATMDDVKKQNLLLLIKEAKKLGFKFSFPSDLFK